MRNYIKYIFLVLIILLTFSADIGEDPPKEKKKDTIVVDTAIIQMEQNLLQEETRNRMSKWDSLLLRQDSLSKKK